MEEENRPIWFIHLKTPLGRTNKISVFTWEESVNLFDCTPVDEKRFGDRIIIPISNVIVVVKERQVE